MNQFEVVSDGEVFEALKPLRSRLGSVECEITDVVEELSSLSTRLRPQDAETNFADVRQSNQSLTTAP